jgi:hypothetical protein
MKPKKKKFNKKFLLAIIPVILALIGLLQTCSSNTPNETTQANGNSLTNNNTVNTGTQTTIINQGGAEGGRPGATKVK